MNVAAIILTGGDGTRMKGVKIPKQFIEVCGKPIFIHCMEIYDKIREIDEICLVVNQRHQSRYVDSLSSYRIKKLKHIVPGGRVRQDSIRNALEKVQTAGFIVVQNGVSPTVPSSLIRKCIATAGRKGIATAYLPAYHTVFCKNANRIKNVLERGKLGYTCDPQVFRSNILQKTLEKVRKNLPNDVPLLSLAAKLGYRAYLVKSDMSNLKVTVESDLKAIEYILESTKET